MEVDAGGIDSAAEAILPGPRMFKDLSSIGISLLALDESSLYILDMRSSHASFAVCCL